MAFKISNDARTIIILSSYAESLYNFRGDLIRELVGEGWRVFALAPDYNPASKARVEELGAVAVSMPLERNGMNLARDLDSFISLYRFMRRVRPAIFFGYFMKPVIYGAIAAWLARVPRRVVMVAGLGFVFINAGRGASAKSCLLKMLVTRLYQMAFRVSHAVIFQNCDDRALMTGAGIAPAERAKLINGSGVNLDRFAMKEMPRPHGPLTFVWTGRLLREKGVFELIEAARLVRDQGFEFRLFLVGGVDSNPGSLSTEIVQNWSDAGLVSWTGKVDDVRPYLAQSDVFILPSYREGLPRSTQEAMAMGLAAITTDVPGCRETVETEVNGILVPARSADAIAEAMIRYINDPLLAERHGRAGRAIVERKFDVRVINRQMAAVLLGNYPAD
ncbi:MULTISPECIES: glycosyltransferase family 4 protein [Sphingopyxis]|uniref:glycosyltransferase family 4 protein n=1 Tax=Sphingopyxis TaxID=165697 RepID=UPI001649396F|nr:MULTISPECIES: glycosyltransferase family 4 protein [Sphingopyxis]QXF11821.1 glycosyltransferase family 4 protein [Sphingopyxis terrae subsp. terrae]